MPAAVLRRTYETKCADFTVWTGLFVQSPTAFLDAEISDMLYYLVIFAGPPFAS